MIGITIVFGTEFLELFCKVTLKSLSTSENLGKLNSGVSEWIINTTEDGAKIICQSSHFKKIVKYTKVRFKIIRKKILLEDKYKLMTEGHNYALNYGFEKQEGVIFLQPDAIYFDGIIKYIQNKKDFAGIFVPSFMVIREKFINKFSLPETATTLQEIKQASCMYLHQFTLDHDIDSKTFRNDCPNFIMSRLNDEHFIFQPMPLGLIYLNPIKLTIKKIIATYDSDLLENFENNIESAFFETEACNCLWPEMSPERRFSDRLSSEPINLCWVLHAWRTEKHFGGINIKEKLLSLKFKLYSDDKIKKNIKKELRLKIVSKILFFIMKKNLFFKLADITKTPNNKGRKLANFLFLMIVKARIWRA